MAKAAVRPKAQIKKEVEKMGHRQGELANGQVPRAGIPVEEANGQEPSPGILVDPKVEVKTARKVKRVTQKEIRKANRIGKIKAGLASKAREIRPKASKVRVQVTNVNIVVAIMHPMIVCTNQLVLGLHRPAHLQQ